MTITIKNGETLIALTKPERKKLADAGELISAMATHGGPATAPVAAKAIQQLQEDLARQNEPTVTAPY